VKEPVVLGPADEIIRELVQHGFRLGYRSSAIATLVHPDYPGLEVRLGTIQVVVERDHVELYRAALADVDLRELLAAARAVASSDS
jgi:hypothetical protein